MSLRSSPLKLGNKSTLTNNFLKTEISDITCKRPIWLNNKNIINLLILFYTHLIGNITEVAFLFRKCFETLHLTYSKTYDLFLL